MKKPATTLKKGHYIKLNNEIWQVLKTERNFRGRGGTNLKAKVRNIMNNNTLARNFGGDQQIEVIDIEIRKLQYLYKDGQFCHFMDSKTYEQKQVPLKNAKSAVDFLKEGDSYFVMIYQDKAISVKSPQSVRLKVTEAEDAVRGDTATGAKKIVILENGMKLNVPLFIKKEDIIVVNTETGEYVERG